MTRDWKDIIIRALKTFAQAAIASIGASFAGVSYMVADQTQSWWVGVGLAAVAAGVSLAWNAVVKPIYEPPKTE